MVYFRQGSRNASWHGIKGSTSLTSTISATHMNTHQCPMSQLSQFTSTTNHFQNVVSQRSQPSQTICPILHIRKILTHLKVSSPKSRNPTEVGGTRLLRKCASHLVMVQ